MSLSPKKELLQQPDVRENIPNQRLTGSSGVVSVGDAVAVTVSIITDVCVCVHKLENLWRPGNHNLLRYIFLNFFLTGMFQKLDRFTVFKSDLQQTETVCVWCD